MKKIIYVVLGVIIGCGGFLMIDYITNKPEMVETIPNDSGVCEGGSCSNQETYYGNNVGDTIEDYTLTDFDGNEVQLYDLMKGYDKVIIALEASWCGDCHRQDDKLIIDGAIPENVLYIPVFTTYSKEGDDERQADYDSSLEYAKDKYAGTNITPYFDTDDILWNEFEAQGTPTNIVLDTNGKIKVISLELDADTLMLENSTDIPYTISE